MEIEEALAAVRTMLEGLHEREDRIPVDRKHAATLVSEVERLRDEIKRMKMRRAKVVTKAHAAVLDAFASRSDWTFRELRAAIPDQAPKALSNALGYLTRKKRLMHVGYGEYRLPLPADQA